MSGAPGGAGRSWEGYIETIAQGLLTIEVNTVEKASMSAQKMPEMPIALHNVIDAYQTYLMEKEVGIDAGLLAEAARRVANLQRETPDPDVETQAVATLSMWKQSTAPLAELENGPDTFEALQWAAWAGLQALKERGTEDEGVLARIRSNSRQLREVAIILARDNPKGDDRQALFGSRIEETLAALFKHPRPQLKIDPDVLVLVRKVWDIGTETVLMQTSVQVDGDVVLRVSPVLAEAKRKFFADLHAGCVQTGLSQWQGLFHLLGDLLGELGKAIFRAAAP